MQGQGSAGNHPDEEQEEQQEEEQQEEQNLDFRWSADVVTVSEKNAQREFGLSLKQLAGLRFQRKRYYGNTYRSFSRDEVKELAARLGTTKNATGRQSAGRPKRSKAQPAAQQGEDEKSQAMKRRRQNEPEPDEKSAADPDDDDGDDDDNGDDEEWPQTTKMGKVSRSSRRKKEQPVAPAAALKSRGMVVDCVLCACVLAGVLYCAPYLSGTELCQLAP
jgi:hypothetical protein